MEDGNFVCDRPIATSEEEFDPEAPHHGKGFSEVLHSCWKRNAPLQRKDIECWSYWKSGFPARSDALAALASFPIEERTVAGQAGRKHWICPDGREEWEFRESEDVLRLDPMYTQIECENAHPSTFNPFGQERSES